MGADPPDIPVRQETPAMIAVELLNGLFRDIPVGVQFLKDILGYLGLYGGGGTPKFIKPNIEPPVYLRMDGVIAVAQFPGAYALLRGPGLGGGAVFVGTADVEGIVTPEPAKPGKGIGGKDLDQVTQMGNIVYIGKG
jgi:hypothetical protein